MQRVTKEEERAHRQEQLKKPLWERRDLWKPTHLQDDMMLRFVLQAYK